MSKKVHFLTMFFLCLCAATRPVQAQERSETAYMFRFVAGSDMFYVPWSGNGSQLDSLLSALSANMEPLRGGERYISVSSYGATSGDARTAARMAYLRCSRVKSELITRGGVTESMFLTDRHIGAPYEGVERNVVVVTFPASVEKVAELAGAEAAARVAAYTRGMSDEQERERMAAEKKAEEERIAKERAEAERLAMEQEARRKAEAEKQTEQEPEPAKEPEAEPKTTPENPIQKTGRPYMFAVRTNLLYDAFAVPTLGVEWRIDRNIGIKVDGSYAFWSKGHGKVQKMWVVSPEVRWYLLKDKRFYVGLSGNVGGCNVYGYPVGRLLAKYTGYQGDVWNAGVTVGYQLLLSRSLSIDFNLGLGYNRFDYDSFGIIDGTRVYRAKSQSKDFWGPTQAGISLMWTIGSKK